MKTLTKALKYAQALNDEEKAEFLEFFKKDEEKGEEEVTKKQEEKEEDKVVDFEKLFNDLSGKLDTTIKEFGSFKEKVEKSKSFGEKAKTKGKNTSNEFDSIFNNLTK